MAGQWGPPHGRAALIVPSRPSSDDQDQTQATEASYLHGHS